MNYYRPTSYKDRKVYILASRDLQQRCYVIIYNLQIVQGLEKTVAKQAYKSYNSTVNSHLFPYLKEVWQYYLLPDWFVIA